MDLAETLHVIFFHNTDKIHCLGLQLHDNVDNYLEQKSGTESLIKGFSTVTGSPHQTQELASDSKSFPHFLQRSMLFELESEGIPWIPHCVQTTAAFKTPLQFGHLGKSMFPMT
ncbi:MAG: hypothetical protein LUC50_08685 [Ruminococcus sp.]|nr:hypothetical protein [Ruminococcus sp.]